MQCHICICSGQVHVDLQQELWAAIDEEIDVKNCEIFSYNPDLSGGELGFICCAMCIVPLVLPVSCAPCLLCSLSLVFSFSRDRCLLRFLPVSVCSYVCSA